MEKKRTLERLENLKRRLREPHTLFVQSMIEQEIASLEYKLSQIE